MFVQRVGGLEIRAAGNDVLVHDPARDKIHVLNRSAGEVLARCDGAHAPADIARLLAAPTGTNNDLVERDVRAVLARFIELGLVEPTPRRHQGDRASHRIPAPMTTISNGRTADHPIESIFLERWSPRAFTGEALPESDLRTILEAARWAPSSYNSQPWRFLYARRDTEHWAQFLGLLNEFNASWASRAGALIIIVSKSTMRPPGAEADVPSHSHSFDTGAAWAQLALQATRLGWHAHGMVGFDRDRAFAELHVPQGYRVEAAVAIGRQGDKSMLPEPLQQREAPSPRQPLSEIAFEGGFPQPK